MNVANSITVFRIFLSPIFLFFFLMEGLVWKIAAFAIVIIAELSDLFDGYIARKYKIVTSFGKLMDPFADNIFRFTVFLCFLAKGLVPLWMVAVIFYRDVIVYVIRNFATLSHIVIAARTSGKIKAIVQGTVINIIIAVIIISYITRFEHTKTIAYWLMLVATIVTLGSGADYIYGNWHIIRKYKK